MLVIIITGTVLPITVSIYKNNPSIKHGIYQVVYPIKIINVNPYVGIIQIRYKGRSFFASSQPVPQAPLCFKLNSIYHKKRALSKLQVLSFISIFTATALIILEENAYSPYLFFH